VPKKSGEDHKAVRLAPTRPAPAVRSINHQTPPADGPHRNPVNHAPIRGSNALAADAVRKASDHDSEIDPTQQHY